MKIVVAVIVYNRFDNVREWIRCWNQSDTAGAQLVIIHNYQDESAKKTCQAICQGVTYIPHENRGFDIGRFQDVCKFRLAGMPEFDYVLWCTDDLLPQRKTFIREFVQYMRPGIVCAAYEISNEVHPHIRTTGFMLHRETLPKIHFNVDPIVTKAECYDFEHRDKVNSLADQIKRMGGIIQVGSVEESPLWDTGHRSREARARFVRRQKEHARNFPAQQLTKILVAVCIYDRLHNLKRWLHAWARCEQMGAKLVIVHNQDKITKFNEFERLCRRAKIDYIGRQNVGFETGVIQDIFLDKIRYDWDVLLFCTDDTLPIRQDFLRHYLNEISKPEVGVAAMEVSGTWTPHIRTTGWAIRREIAKNVHWVHVPIVTKEDCYFFEHSGFEDTLMSQILKMDKRVIQLSDLRKSVMWDTHHHEDHDRWEEWNEEFPNFRI